MARMVILDKARALDRIVSLSIRVVVPDGLSRSALAVWDATASHRSATRVLPQVSEAWEPEAVATIRPADEVSAAHATAAP
jgi:hypothetical protein